MIRLLKLLNEQDRWSLIILFLVVAAFFLPTFTTPNTLIWSYSYLGSDIDNRHWADFTHYAASLRGGSIPLWDSSVAMGRPLPGDPDVVFAYPLVVLFVFLPTALAFNVYDAFHVFLAGVLMFFFLRIGYSLSRPASLMGGLAFAFMPKFISHIASGHVGLIAAVALVPAVWLGLKYSMDHGSYLGAVLAGLVMAIQLPLHIQMPYYTAFVASIFWVWQLAPALWKAVQGDRTLWHHVVHLSRVYAVWLVAFLLLGAFLILPMLELLPYNPRADFSLEDANSFALLPSLLLTLLTPTLRFRLHEWTVFLGVLPPLLAVVGILASPQKIKWLLLAIVIFAVLFMLGTATPIHSLSFYLIPGFRFFRVPTRFWFFGGLALILLAALGVQALSDLRLPRQWRRHRGLWVRCVGIYLFGGAISVIAYYVLFQEFHYFLAMQLLTMIAVGLLGWHWLSERLNGILIQWLLIPLLLFDLLPVANSFINVVNPQETFLRSTPALDYVNEQKGLFRVYATLGDQPYSLAAERKVDLLDGLLAFQLAHVVNVIHEATGCSKERYATSIPACLDDVVPTATPNAELLGRLNVRYVLSPLPLSDPNFQLVKEGRKIPLPQNFKSSIDGTIDHVYENALWLPRARLTSSGTADFVKRVDGEFEIAVNASETTQLIVSETWLPGWRAWVDGREVAVKQVEGALIGVTVSTGDRLVRLSYDPLGWRIGWKVTLISLILLGIWIVFSFVRPKRVPQQ